MGRDKRHQMTAGRGTDRTALERDGPPGAEAVAKLRSMRREILLGVVAQCGLKGETLDEQEARLLAREIRTTADRSKRQFPPADKVKVTKLGAHFRAIAKRARLLGQ